MLGVAGFGAYFYRRSQSIEGFALGSRHFPGWALAFSFLGTYLSSISFLANAGKTFQSDWRPFVFSLTLPIAAWVASRFFIPFYRKGGFRTAYEHLEHRFGYWARAYASASLILLQIGRIALVLFLISLAMQFLLGWDKSTIIIALGIITILYTVVGGMEAVVWTDVVQTIVLTVGAIFCLILLLMNMPVSVSEAFEFAQQNHKFELGDFSIFATIFLFGIVENLRNFGVDQNYVQRILAAKSEKEAQISLWAGALTYIPLSAVFFLIGTLLWVYYTQLGQIASLPNPDQVFPFFIVTELPVGVKGFVIAAIFAAGMSTLDSSINVSANVWVTDFYSRLRHNTSEQQQLTQIRLATIVIGILGIIGGLFMIRVEAAALDIWWRISAAFGGGMLGLFLLGLFFPKVGNRAALIGCVMGVVLVIWGTFSQYLPEYLAFPWEDKLTVAYLAMLVIIVTGVGYSFVKNK